MVQWEKAGTIDELDILFSEVPPVSQEKSILRGG